MAPPWESYLNEIGLQPTDRLHAQLNKIADFPDGYPEKSRLSDLLEQIEKIYGNEEFVVMWIHNGGRIYKKIASTRDVEKISCLWERIAGNYILFLPCNAIVEKGKVQDEELFIGQCLKRYKKLVLKTEDAYVVLLLQLA
jgi:hypothetical protein